MLDAMNEIAEARDINIHEKLGDLMARRAAKNPSINNIRYNAINKIKATNWNLWHASKKSEANQNWK
jgi:hypothetical protein